MKQPDRPEANLRVKGPLALSPSSSSFLAIERGRKRGNRWVLKWVGKPAGESSGLLFRDDIARLSSLSHPALALPTSFGRDPRTGRAYLLRPFIQGSEILVAAQGKSTKEILPWLVSAAEALRLLHRFGFLHRNLKPTNLIVSRRACFSHTARGTIVALCDPAWWPKDEPSSRKEPPAGERREKGKASIEADLFDLAVIFYRLLTGKDMELDGGGFPVPPSRLNPGISVDLDRLILKALHPDPSRRYQDAGVLMDDLRLLCGAKAPPRLAPPDCFLDRKDEIERALARLGKSASSGEREDGGWGRPAALAVTGEAGMGKSAFLHRLALEAQVLGYRTVQVRCYPESTAPFAPLASLADGLFSTSTQRRALRRSFGRIRQESASREGPGKSDPGARQRFLRGLLGLFAEARGQNPAVLFVDDVHLADSVTLEFLAGLVRDIRAIPSDQGPERMPPGLVVSYRAESPFRPALRPLLEAFQAGGDGGLTIELRPLPKETAEEWLDLAEFPDGEGKKEVISGFQGNPFALHQAIRRSGSRRGEMPAIPKDLSTIHENYLASLDREGRRILQLIAVLGRPASSDFVGEALGPGGARLRPSFDALLEDGALVEEAGLLFFRHGSFRSWIQETIGREEKEALHRRIASLLQGREDGAIEEIAYHWLHSDEPVRGVSAALEAARNLVRNHENRKALTLYQAVLEHLPKRNLRTRRTVSEETAETFSRTGEHGRGMEILRSLLPGAKGRREAGHLHARLGILAHRSGDIARAAFHLEKSLGLLAGVGGIDGVRERLTDLSELAEISNTKGDYQRAEALCQEALEELKKTAGAREDAGIRCEEMVILETLAHLRLRRFQYDEARELFEKSLSVGESLGAIPERGLILNNLGTLHVQENRFHKAIECYERATRLSERLRDDQSLSIIQSNLSVLYARIGEPEAAERAMGRAREHDARGRSLRTRFLRLHSAGIVDLSFGRYASAIDSFRAAIPLGEELKDLHMVAFELVFLAECHLFRGEGKAARAALERAVTLGPSPPAPVLSMAEARKALLAALRGDGRSAKAGIRAAEEKQGAAIPYIEAWNKVFLGWAYRLLGLSEKARTVLEEAREFFSSAKVPSGEILSSLELAAAEAEAGRQQSAEKRLQSLRERFACGKGPLKSPMLSARLLACQARLLLERNPPQVDAATALLLEAESYLIGRKLRELEAFTAELRDRIRRIGPGAQGKSSLSPPARLSGDSPRGSGGPSLAGGEGGHASWDSLEMLGALKGNVAEVLRRIEEDLGPEIGEERVRSLCRSLSDFEERIQEAERSLEKRSPSDSLPLRASSIIGRSEPIRRMIDLILQVAPTQLPVLITGETGSGKEIVARAIHGESPRRGAPLVSVNCAALPAELLEAQLFGSLRGAFTGAEEDRPGLLLGANGGTFLFDEIGEMPIGLQAKLLRFLDRGRLRPIGGSEEIEVNVRYLFSSNRDLGTMVKEGGFREDLFFRLSTFEIRVPPLRERLEDLPALTDHFRSAARGTRDSPPFAEGALQALASHPWPGNVRELQNVVTRLCLTASEEITAEQVRLLIGKAPIHRLFSTAILRSRPLDQLSEHLEREYLLQLHADRGGDLEAMAGALGITVRALYDRFKRLGIRPREIR